MPRPVEGTPAVAPEPEARARRPDRHHDLLGGDGGADDSGSAHPRQLDPGRRGTALLIPPIYILATLLFRNRTSNLGLITQNAQWLVLMGVSFVVAAYLQVVRGYNAVQTGVIFTAATAGLLISSLAAGRLAKRRSQRTLIMAGITTTPQRSYALAMVVLAVVALTGLVAAAALPRTIAPSG